MSCELGGGFGPDLRIQSKGWRTESIKKKVGL